MKIRSFLKSLALLLILSSLGACGTISLNSSSADVKEVKKRYANQSVTKVIERLTLRMGKAGAERFELYSPGLYEKAKSAFRQAQSLYRGKAPANSVLRQAFMADTRLDDAFKAKHLAKQHLSDVFDAIESLENKKIATAYLHQFNIVVSEAGYLVEDLEGRVRLGGAVDSKFQQGFDKNRHKLLEKIQTLKVEVVRYNVLEKTLSKLDEFMEDAKKYAPKSYAQIEKAQRAVDAVIKRDVDDDAAVKQASADFQFAVNHAMHVTRAVMKLHKLDRNAYEDYVMDLERKLIPISNALERGEVRDRNFYEQTILLTQAAGKLMHEVNKLKRKNAQLVAKAKTKDLPQAANQRVARNLSLQDETKTQEEVKALNKQIAKLQFVIKGLQRNERPLKDKIWLLEQQLNDLGLENKLLHRRKRELENKLSRR